MEESLMDMRIQTRAMRRAGAKFLNQESAKWPPQLIQIPEADWPKPPEDRKTPMPLEIWRSRSFLVQVHSVRHHAEMLRLSISRASIQRDGNWSDQINWDELQQIKRECGHGERQAVEIFPADRDIVNVANMRHLWVFTDGRGLPFAWGKP
jgi:hypothetical protein